MDSIQLLTFFIFHRMKITPDTKVQNAATFEILREDHTMGNVIRQ